MIFGKNQPKKQRPCSFRWILLSFIALTGIFQMIALNYYFATGKLSHTTPHQSQFSEHLAPIYMNNKMEIISTGEGGKDFFSTNNEHRKTDVIVYLAQFGNHSSYGAQVDANKKSITGLSKLNKSLELLYTNYANQFPTDVIIFYESFLAPDADTMAELQRNRPHLQFRALDKKWWGLPYGLKYFDYMTWSRPAFSVGYRLMMRWFAVLIWHYLDAENYTHCMRLDDDSYILSKIEYNLFDYMRDNKKRYAFRNPVHESDDAFDKLIDKYLADYPTAILPELARLYKQDTGVGFYNNFFMAEISFFLSPPASTLLRIIDESKLIFTKRTGDLVIQSAVVRLFLRPEEIHWFRDFTYEHMTICRKDKCGYGIRKGCPQNGGVARGIGVYTDAEWRTFAEEEVRNRFKDNPNKCQIPLNECFLGADDVRICTRLSSKCGYYLSLIPGVNETARSQAESWKKGLLQEASMLNKTFD